MLFTRLEKSINLSVSHINYCIVQDTIPEASHWPEKQFRICGAIHIFYVISDNLVRYVLSAKREGVVGNTCQL